MCILKSGVYSVSLYSSVEVGCIVGDFLLRYQSTSRGTKPCESPPIFSYVLSPDVTFLQCSDLQPPSGIVLAAAET